MHLIGSRLSLSLDGRTVVFEAPRGMTLRACYERREGRPILRVSSYLDSTLDREPELSWIYDGIGWTCDGAFSIGASPAPLTTQPSDDRPSSSGGELERTLRAGGVSMGEYQQWLSITKGSRSESSAGPGGARVDPAEWLRLRMTSAEPGPQS